MIPWILIAVGLAAVVLAILGILIYKKRGWKRTVDYRNYYNMGLAWVPLGIVFSIVLESAVGLMFLLLGLAYLAIGLKNRDKWGKKVKVSPKSQRMFMVGVLIGVVVLIVGIIVFELMV